MPSIGVLEHFQKVTDRPSRRIKKAGGQSLVNRGMAVWIRENVLLIMRARPVFEVHANSMTYAPKYTPNSGRSSIPEKLPANIDYKLGLVVQAPILANQIRFRPIAEQGL